MTATINTAGLTDIGRHRESNEDGYLILDLGDLTDKQSPERPAHAPRPQLLIVADGMGGHASGGKASELAIDAFGQYVRDHVHAFVPSCDEPDAVLRQLEAATRDAHEAIEDYAGSRPEANGMGTTLTAAAIVWPYLYVAHVGDSRCYLLTGRQLEQLTADHTLAELLTSGTVEPGEHDGSEHTIWNSLAHGAESVQVDTFQRSVEGAAAVLLCTDGLHGHVSDDQIAATLVANGAEAACRKLIGSANDAGGRDNITVVVAEFAATERAAVETVEAEFPLAEVIRVTEGQSDDGRAVVTDTVQHEVEYVEEQIPATE